MTAADELQILSITPEPTDAERAAIVAAVEALKAKVWPQLNGATMPDPSPRWRYAGRPWRSRQSYGGWR
ncbi:MAG: hypothetical protein F4Y12_11685 [Acidimicrobiaceae bacterium]|nr:hypothetical protein [Acidimicrobiaceae bacterium]MXZ53404.1 hypothetical protein [Acidimicrobiaceae bacterium]MYA86230.1 hypothetical protein [Acidimicrobiaceae bacterium]MYB88113.1 hypothetical protein [Acidimicrobiaceae bacterium]MYH78077.1 hypothetical protein [Acidimicrobiaceae bacterium]